MFIEMKNLPTETPQEPDEMMPRSSTLRAVKRDLVSQEGERGRNSPFCKLERSKFFLRHDPSNIDCIDVSVTLSLSFSFFLSVLLFAN